MTRPTAGNRVAALSTAIDDPSKTGMTWTLTFYETTDRSKRIDRRAFSKLVSGLGV
jgi:hypothetical protein